ncbi:hypothetical protein M8J77_012142 [Diaphorina citri]|nr:hypothetical protein M8J77_012142 [Diaphorina citri]
MEASKVYPPNDVKLRKSAKYLANIRSCFIKKSEQDIEREQSLVEQWVNLTEERNAVLVPAPGSGIPGAPADWNPPSGMEPHIPVLFLDLNADDLSASNSGPELDYPVAGLHSILPKEHGTKFYNLPLVRHLNQEVGAVATWDSSVHDSQHLNKITESNERVYMILKTTVRLSHPAPMDLVLRKRLSLNIFKRQSLTERIRKRISRSDWLTQTGVTYEVVSNIPKASEELEERESLAQIAASGEEASLVDGETYIEKYTRGVSAVEGILTLDRMRQNVAVKELLQNQGYSPAMASNSMRKTASVPNFSQMMSSFESMGNVARSESVADLNAELTLLTLAGSRTPRTEPVDLNSKSFGIASPSSKLGFRMETLHEEKPRGEARLSSHTEEEEEEEEREGDVVNCTSAVTKPLSLSRTLDSLSDFNTAKVTTPSTFSSGYGSEAVSSSNLTNDDTLSIKSISDDTPDQNTRPISASQSFETKSLAQNLQEDKTQRHDRRKSSSELPETFNTIAFNDKKHEKAKDVLKSDDTSKVATEKPEFRGEERQNPFNKNFTIPNYSNDKLTNHSDKLTNHSEKLTNHSIEKVTNHPNGKPSDPPIVDNEDTLPSVTITEDLKCKTLPEDMKSSMSSSLTISSDMASSSLTVSSEMDSCSDLDKRSSSSSLSSHDENKVVRRKSSTRRSSQSRASYPMSGDQSFDDVTLPEWVCIGESVLIRPYNSSGVIAYIGPTEFAAGTWVGVELDAPTGKNDGTVQGTRYFESRPKHGIFVRADKLIQDRRGRAMRSGGTGAMRRSTSRGDGLNRSRSRSEGLSSVGTRNSTSARGVK